MENGNENPQPAPAVEAKTGEGGSAMAPNSVERTPSEQHRGSGDREGKKRKRPDKARLQHGARSKRRDMGRGEYFRDQPDKRARNEAEQAKRRKLEEQGVESVLPKAFAPEEIAAEERKPKRKVAVMIGYSGSGYKGMQINTTERTIEGDLFTAFVKAGAISKVNADDPKKSSLVRCARTDKGVHAAGNVISLKLIIEDADIVEKINSHLSPQIRVWGIQRTISSFSCYQACDSRWYEYLIPTHSFLPPHPSSFLGRKLVEEADKAGDREAYESRQHEIANFWAETEEKYIKPILETLDPSVRQKVEQALYGMGDDITEDQPGSGVAVTAQPVKIIQKEEGSDVSTAEKTEEAAILLDVPAAAAENGTDKSAIEDQSKKPEPAKGTAAGGTSTKAALEAAVKELKNAYITAKKAYRISDERIARVREVLNMYVGTRNYHNYTIQKKFRDPSAKRHIKSFKVSDKPIIINDTEWLSLKVHGQSFMMHQIRKMVGMAALIVRCGCPPSRIEETFKDVDISIPKVPGLGLLLERPVFDSYNSKAAAQFEREKIDFTKYENEMEEFKQREIYQRIFREEGEGNVFHSFFSHIDNYREPYFLFVTSGGIKAAVEGVTDAKKGGAKGKPAEFESEDEGSGGEG